MSEGKINDILTRGVINIIPNKDNLSKLLLSEKKLNIYLGIDPTATKIHIGHGVLLRKLQMFADLGHYVTFLIGDFTALIGDTSDKTGERPSLTYDKVKENFKSYKSQAEKILDFDKIKVVHNSQWLKDLNFEDIIKLAQNFSVGDFVSRTLIRNRIDAGKRVGLHETLYPIMQGYDSMHLDTDIQIGAADQTFNMQAGRTLMKKQKNKESFVLITDYLIGTDGQKMSKTSGNAIWIKDPPEEMYGKIMSIKDNLIEQYFTLVTNTPLDEIKKLKQTITKSPMDAKKKLAYTIVTELHSDEDAKSAQEYFEKTFQKKVPEYRVVAKDEETLVKTIMPHTPMRSMTNAKRLISQEAVSVNGKVVTDPNFGTSSGQEIKLGKRTFLKVK